MTLRHCLQQMRRFTENAASNTRNTCEMVGNRSNRVPTISHAFVGVIACASDKNERNKYYFQKIDLAVKDIYSF